MESTHFVQKGYVGQFQDIWSVWWCKRIWSPGACSVDLSKVLSSHWLISPSFDSGVDVAQHASPWLRNFLPQVCNVILRHPKLAQRCTEDCDELLILDMKQEQRLREHTVVGTQIRRGMKRWKDEAKRREGWNMLKQTVLRRVKLYSIHSQSWLNSIDSVALLTTRKTISSRDPLVYTELRTCPKCFIVSFVCFPTLHQLRWINRHHLGDSRRCSWRWPSRVLSMPSQWHGRCPTRETAFLAHDGSSRRNAMDAMVLKASYWHQKQICRIHFLWWFKNYKDQFGAKAASMDPAFEMFGPACGACAWEKTIPKGWTGDTGW